MLTQRHRVTDRLVACLVAAALGGVAAADNGFDILAVSKTGQLSGAVATATPEFVQLETPIDVQGFDNPVDVEDSISLGGGSAQAAVLASTTPIDGGFRVTIEATSAAETNGCPSCIFAFGDAGIAVITAIQLDQPTRLQVNGNGLADVGFLAAVIADNDGALFDMQCDASECPPEGIEVSFDQVLPAGQYTITVGAGATAGLECSPPCSGGSDASITTWSLDVIAVRDTSECPGDVDGDGEVGFTDLLAVLASWGPCAGCPEDLDGDGEVGFTDLLMVLPNWGSSCP